MSMFLIEMVKSVDTLLDRGGFGENVHCSVDLIVLQFEQFAINTNIA